MSAEKWRAIPGYEGRYDVSDQGRVRSVTTYHGVRPPRIMATETDRYGYPFVRLSSAGERVRSRRKIHTLVLLAFVGPRPEGMVSRHLSGDPSDARLVNLIYGTQSQNLRDAVAHGTHHWSARTHCANGHEYTPENTRRKASKAGRICVTCDRSRARAGARRRRAAA
jgi:hypothetical protein